MTMKKTRWFENVNTGEITKDLEVVKIWERFGDIFKMLAEPPRPARTSVMGDLRRRAR